MNKLGNLLWKLFSTIVMFYHQGSVADAPCNYDSDLWARDTKLSTYFTTGNSSKDETICPEGQYLASCGDFVLGTNWLKSTAKMIGNRLACTPSFYPTDSNTDKMGVLREFFADGSTLSCTYNNGDAVTNNECANYKEYRNIILSLVCTNSVGQLITTCKTCPNDAIVPASTVQKTSYDGTIFRNSWNIHTIADCYFNEISDTTGTYVYVPDNVAGSTISKTCYYSKNISGTLPILQEGIETISGTSETTTTTTTTTDTNNPNGGEGTSEGGTPTP